MKKNISIFLLIFASSFIYADICTKCCGIGKYLSRCKVKECGRCSGTGRTSQSLEKQLWQGLKEKLKVCVICSGTGLSMWGLCTSCDGAGFKEEYPNQQVSKIIKKILNTTAKSMSEEAWGESGRVMYNSAASIMLLKNIDRSKYQMDSVQKIYLRPYFGSLVDKINIIYSAELMDEWKILGVIISHSHSQAQTYGYDIYVKENYKYCDIEQIILIGHELAHSKQYQEYGESLSNFGYHYFKEYKRGGMIYENNKLEKEAYSIEENLRNIYMDSKSEPEPKSKTNSTPRKALGYWKGNMYFQEP